VLPISVEGNNMGGTFVSTDVIKTGLERSALTEVEGMTQNPSPSLVCNSSAVIAASIVDTHHVFKVLGQIFDDGTNDFCLIEQRNDNPRMGFSIRSFR
jgi:hypothetical protein